MRKRKVRMARLVRRSEMDESFDVEFWRRVGAEGRFAAMWQMVKEVQAIRGGDGRQLRLQKSVEHLVRREQVDAHPQDLLEARRLSRRAAKRKSTSRRRRRSGR